MAGDVVVARWQFAFTIMFHYLFPVLTMGLGVPHCGAQDAGVERGNRAYGRAARFWARVFAITFATGVVTGLPMEFQFGTNWARFSHFAGVWSGRRSSWKACSPSSPSRPFWACSFSASGACPGMHWLSAVMVACGAVLSGFFIVATDAWMQHPVGYRIDGRAELTSLWGLLSNPYVRWQSPTRDRRFDRRGLHGDGRDWGVLPAARRHEVAGRTFLRTGITVGAACSVLSLFPTGSFQGENVARYQPSKMAAMEGLFHTQERAGIAIIGMPDTAQKKLIDPIIVPGVLSYLIYGDFRARVVGLNDIPQDQHPPVEIVYYAYHIMVGLGTIFIAVLGLSAFLLWRGRLYTSRGMLWVLMLAVPFPYIANHAGWVVAEVGRH